MKEKTQKTDGTRMNREHLRWHTNDFCAHFNSAATFFATFWPGFFFSRSVVKTKHKLLQNCVEETHKSAQIANVWFASNCLWYKKSHQSAGLTVCVLLFSVFFIVIFAVVFELFSGTPIAFISFCSVFFNEGKQLVRKQIDCYIIYCCYVCYRRTGATTLFRRAVFPLDNSFKTKWCELKLRERFGLSSIVFSCVWLCEIHVGTINKWINRINACQTKWSDHWLGDIWCFCKYLNRFWMFLVSQ